MTAASNRVRSQSTPTVRPESLPISAAFPFESRFADVHGSKMHYIDVGKGDPVIFIHGNPASSYLWRNVIPHVQAQGFRCIAFDLIGMGKSDRPDIDYTYDDHARYVAGFIDSLDLGDNITLVIHDWGSMLGFDWAANNTHRVKAVAFMEAMVRPLSYSDLPGALKIAMRVLRFPATNWLLGGVANIFLNVMLQDLTLHKLTPETLGSYKADYSTIRSRIAVRTFSREVPFDGFPQRSYDLVTSYIDWIAQTDVPMILFHGDDGVAIKADEVQWLRDNVTNLEVVDVGHGKHFLQETHPHVIGANIARWRAAL